MPLGAQVIGWNRHQRDMEANGNFGESPFNGGNWGRNQFSSVKE